MRKLVCEKRAIVFMDMERRKELEMNTFQNDIDHEVRNEHFLKQYGS